MVLAAVAADAAMVECVIGRDVLDVAQGCYGGRAPRACTRDVRVDPPEQRDIEGAWAGAVLVREPPLGARECVDARPGVCVRFDAACFTAP